MDEQTVHKTQEVNARWNDFRPMIDTYRGAEAAAYLANLRDADKAMWNAMRNKVYRWMFVRFARREMSNSERELGLDIMDVGRCRFVHWMHSIYPDRPDPYTWNDEDLKYMLQEIRDGRQDAPGSPR